MTSYALPMPKFIQESIATLCVQHSITTAHFIKAFMIAKTGCFNVLVRRLGVSQSTVHYKCTQKLGSLLTSIMATVYESLPVKCLALLKLSTYLCRYRPSQTVYLAIELYLLPCGRKRATLVPGSIAIIVDVHKKIFSSFHLQWGRGDLKP